MAITVPAPAAGDEQPSIEQQIAELRAHAVQHLAERGTEPTPEHWAQWHEFLDIDPDLRGRDYTGGAA
ncbi:hypothetical protein [Streptomyces wuyuanensis]|uniref:hypothetical protein n=1 Tax=Streptomyces wuyuanensis TaxID=1196353 RepID=UPI003419EC6A